MCGCHFKVRSIQIIGATNGDLVVGGSGDGLHAELYWEVWHSMPLDFVCADPCSDTYRVFLQTCGCLLSRLRMPVRHPA